MRGIPVLAAVAAAALAHLAGDARPGSPPRLAASASASGDLSIAADGSAFDAALRPGETRSGDVVLRASAALDAGTLSGEAGGALAPRLRLRIDEEGGVVYEGSLPGLGSVPLRAFAGGERRRYRLTVAFPDGGPGADNALQGASAAMRLRWTATTPEVAAAAAEPAPAVAESRTAPAARPAARPTVRLVRAPRRAGRRRVRRVVRVVVRCPVSCRATARLQRRRSTLSASTRAIAGSGRVVITLRPPRRRPRGLAVRSVTVRVVARDSAGRTAALTRTVRVRYRTGR